MRSSPYAILSALRCGERLEREAFAVVAQGAVNGSWSDAQLAAFLMGVACRGLDAEATLALMQAMLESGEQWNLRQELPQLGDKHSTGGVGDKITLVLGPLLAEAGIPIAMLTGRGLGHTGGTADKLAVIPGLYQELTRRRALELLDRVGLALGIASQAIAPADRKLYALRDHTATVESLPLIVASILSKKLALGPSAIVFDVKVGNGAFLPTLEAARELASHLVEISSRAGVKAAAWLSDMNQPLGDFVGHTAEVREALAVLEGGGPQETRWLTVKLAMELASLLGRSEDQDFFEKLLDSGRPRERFLRWAEAQGGDPHWLAHPHLPLAPVERILQAPRSGYLKAVATKDLGLLLAEAGAGRSRPEDPIDPTIAFRYCRRVGDRVEAGEELGRLYLPQDNSRLVARVIQCFVISDEPSQRLPILYEHIGKRDAA